MADNLFLADLAALDETAVKQHIANNYAGTVSGFDYGNPTDAERQELLDRLNNFDILVAYESVGDHGCDSASWFLIREKQTGNLFESHGDHCSCYGFEGQWWPEATTIEHMLSDKFHLPTGGYDGACDTNRAAVIEFVRKIGASHG